MQERRKAPRVPYNAKFNVDSLFRENHDILNDWDALD